MSLPGPSVWSEERLEMLSRMWSEGLPISRIGSELGVTRNAVVGKVHRLGLPKRQSPIQRSSEPVEPARREPSHLATTVWVRNRCNWPIGDPQASDFHFCGDPIQEGRPYCEAHCAIAYTTYSRNRSDAVA